MPVRIFGGAFALAAVCLSCGRAGGPGPSAAAARPNVLLVTIDTLRADRLGIGLTPAIDRIAQRAVRFASARAAAPLTLPSHATILTGELPPSHGVRANGEVLGEGHATIATRLHGAGYRTAAFVGAFVLDRRFGLSRGFDTYDDAIARDPAAAERLEAERPASAVVDRALAWLDGTAAPRTPHPAPFFVWIHLYDPHAPYNPPPEFLARAQQAVGGTQPNPKSPIPNPTELRYDGEIAYADAQIGRVFDWLRGRGLAGGTLVVVAGDHGEGLGEHGERTHGMLLYDSTLRVPLVVAPPAGAGVEPALRTDPVGLADIAPTILHVAGVAPPGTGGRDLLSAAGGSLDLYSETEYPRVAGWSPLQALTDGRWMTIQSGPSAEVYDLLSDPGEQHDVAAAQGAVASAMRARIAAIRAAAARRGDAPRGLSPEARDRLRALGYVAAAAPPGEAPQGPNPASRIATWNRFEEALSALTARRAEALPMLEALARANPDAPVMQSTWARALRDAGRLGAALAAYRRAVARWPEDATLVHDLAVAAREAARPATGADRAALREEATRAERASIALAPASAMAHNGLGLLAADAGRAREAVAEFDRATALDPTNASYWANLGNARRELHDAAGAERAYRRALAVDARAADAANGLGVLSVEAQRPAEAAAWFERAIAAAPDFVEARLNLGIALQQSGQAARAAEQYRLVLGAGGRHPKEKEAAAKLLAALGR